MLTKFRVQKCSRSIILLTAAGLIVSAVCAQEVVPPVAQTAPVSGKPFFGIVPLDKKRERFDIHVKSVSLLELLAELAKQSGKKILFSNEMRARPDGGRFELEFEDIRLIDLVTYLAGQNNFSWGSIGDTWLIVPREPEITPVYAPPVLVMPSPNPDFSPLPNRSAPPKTPPKGQPFTFNGGTFYLVPLAPVKAAEAK